MHDLTQYDNFDLSPCTWKIDHSDTYIDRLDYTAIEEDEIEEGDTNIVWAVYGHTDNGWEWLTETYSKEIGLTVQDAIVHAWIKQGGFIPKELRPEPMEVQ